jgi:hypothetical protein
MEAASPKKPARYELWVAIAISLFAAVAFYFSTNPTLHDLDYTAEIASAFLRGDLGLREKPPEWLNEMIPYGDRYYSAFPLGAVLSMVPVALLQKASLIHDFPARILGALIAGACVYFFFQLAKAFGPDYSILKPKRLTRRILLALFPVFGTWTWCNLGMGGAWQIALGLALLGETAALYFTLVRRPSSLGRSSLLLSEIGPSLSSQPLSSFIFSGAAPCLQRRRLACRSSRTQRISPPCLGR